MGMIRFRQMSKRFGRRVAVDSLTLEIGRGEVVALLGPNGSGKTTSLKAAAGLIRPSSGQILLGEPARSASDPRARQILSFLPQRVAFPESLTGRETLEFFRLLRGATAARVDDALRFASLNGAGDRPVGTYSGGMAQRLGLAAAVLPDAPVLLLDEPTAALDPDGLRAFHDVVRRYRADGKTILFTSHQMGDVERLADRIAILVDGRLTATLSAPEMTRRLAGRGVLRIRVSGSADEFLAKAGPVLRAARAVGDEIIVPGAAESRPAALDAIRSTGAEITAISSVEGSLDELFRDLIREAL